jgi:hypothetical protein
VETVFRCPVVVLTTLSAAVACTRTSRPPSGDTPPIVVHAKQPKSLAPDWADSAVKSAREAACEERSPGRWGWTTQSVEPHPESAEGPLPVKMTGRFGAVTAPVTQSSCSLTSSGRPGEY